MTTDLSAIRQIRLGDELRALRLDQNKKLLEVTRGLKGWSAARLSKMERADQPVGPQDLATLLDYYGVGGADREYYENLLGSGPPKQWWRNLDFANSITAAFAEYLALEADASHMLEYFPSAFPGLVQTESYAREMIAAGLSAPNDEQIETAAEVRMMRQRRLADENPLDLETYFGEVTLLVAGDRDTLIAQIRHTIEVAQRPNVTIRMVPLSAGRQGILTSGLVLMRFPDDLENGFVFIEAVGGTLPRRTGRDVRRAERAFARVKACALSPEETIAALERRLEEIT
ncbi:helix-turn-helix domain-containing protein [Kitasatospora sp. NPDC058201]|uniref:helix-turn-helix domain-containing protein n=1 Tax=Streptomycetaceae TaxID=2062 RepID=UPI002E77EC94|nr:helix-turn-helix transcriptional regulator [Streptomyces sp. BE303]MED7948143.1 helix-turn-helix transcriptional regulator [Streptomyces sp. BE303]